MSCSSEESFWCWRQHHSRRLAGRWVEDWVPGQITVAIEEKTSQKSRAAIVPRFGKHAIAGRGPVGEVCCGGNIEGGVGIGRKSAGEEKGLGACRPKASPKKRTSSKKAWSRNGRIGALAPDECCCTQQDRPAKPRQAGIESACSARVGRV